jgi:hypothetical protein
MLSRSGIVIQGTCPLSEVRREHHVPGRVHRRDRADGTRAAVSTLRAGAPYR